MKRTLLWAAMIWVLSAGPANALVLQVTKQDGGNVVLRLAMTDQEYKSAAGQMGGKNPIEDSSIPGMNDVNIALPLTADEYKSFRANAATDAASAGKTWCVVCAKGGSKLGVTARNAFGAAMIGTKQCEEKSQSQDLEVTGMGSCAEVGNN